MNNDTDSQTYTHPDNARLVRLLACLLSQHSKIANDCTRYSIQTNIINKYQRTSFDGKQIAYACLNLFMADSTRDHLFSLSLTVSGYLVFSTLTILLVSLSSGVCLRCAHFKHSHFFSTFIIIVALKGSLSLESISIAICCYTQRMIGFNFIHAQWIRIVDKKSFKFFLSRGSWFHNFYNGNCIVFFPSIKICLMSIFLSYFALR